MDQYLKHKSVLLEEVILNLTDGLDPNGEYHFADLTFGGGGHSLQVASMFNKSNIISFDQDPEAFVNGQKIIKSKDLQNQILLIKSNFENFKNQILNLNEEILFDGILLDLGVSSHHFDKPDRGFSFKYDAKLDMRMDIENDDLSTAQDLVNNLDESELEKIFSTYGQERFSRRIAQKIIEVREDEKIRSTKQLENIIFHCYPKKLRFGRTNPSTKCFQALRIAVNRELDVLEKIIPDAFEMLKVGGKLAIISFHSLEDRIVKQTFRKLDKVDGIARVITKKPITPDVSEIKENSRSRSAKLRVLRKIGV